jgi:hypothetical protein
MERLENFFCGKAMQLKHRIFFRTNWKEMIVNPYMTFDFFSPLKNEACFQKVGLFFTG